MEVVGRDSSFNPPNPEKQRPEGQNAILIREMEQVRGYLVSKNGKRVYFGCDAFMKTLLHAVASVFSVSQRVRV